MVRKAEERGAIASRRRAREEGWRKHLKAWRGSGLSQAEYCRRHGMAAADFSWWKCELARRDQARRPKPAKTNGFVPVRLPVAPMGAGVVVRGQPVSTQRASTTGNEAKDEEKPQQSEELKRK